MNTPFDVTLYGLTIRTEVPLPGRPAAQGTPADLNIFYGPPIPSQEGAPEGHVLAYHELSAGKWYAFVRLVDGGFVLRVANVCDFMVDAELRQAEVRPVAGGAADLVPVFAAGALPSCLLLMKGEPVLHASAVDVGGQVVAFVGRSGMGKSTVATLCCAAGGRLVTDDVLRLTPGARPCCYLGASELRLRQAHEVTAAFTHRPDMSGTGDGRSAVRAAASAEELLPLAAIVVPLPDREVKAPAVDRLKGPDGLLALLHFPRIVGWEDGPTQAQQFGLLADVAGSVPVFTARVPWGPPFAAGVARALMGALNIDAALLSA